MTSSERETQVKPYLYSLLLSYHQGQLVLRKLFRGITV